MCVLYLYSRLKKIVLGNALDVLEASFLSLQIQISALKEKARSILQSVVMGGLDLHAEQPGGGDDDAMSEDDEGEKGVVPPELKLDFSGLNKALRKTLDVDSRVRTDKQLLSTIAHLESELQQAVPNLKAPEEYAGILVEEQSLINVSASASPSYGSDSCSS